MEQIVAVLEEELPKYIHEVKSKNQENAKAFAFSSFMQRCFGIESQELDFEKSIKTEAMQMRGRISFYEIKPAEPRSNSNPTTIYLRVTQENWIKKNCLEKKIKAYIVYYLQHGKKFTYRAIKLTNQNLKKYSKSSSKSSRIATMEKQIRDYNRGKIRFT